MSIPYIREWAERTKKKKKNLPAQFSRNKICSRFRSTSTTSPPSRISWFFR